MKIRTTKTASGAKAAQVVRYQKSKRIVMQHIGSAHSEVALNELLLLAEERIKNYSKQLSVFADENPSNLLVLNQSTFVGVRYR